MTIADFVAILSGTGLPVAYSAFPEGAAPPLPWICYLLPGTDNFFADGIAYEIIRNARVELYTQAKDPELENTVQTALTNAGIAWQIESSGTIESERCHMTSYIMEV